MENDDKFFLNQENQALKDENERLRKHLAAKRYKAVDKVVDSVYKIVPRPRRKPKSTTPKKINGPRKIEAGRVDLINHNFYDWDGKVLYKGGAERYVYDLAVLLQSLGYSPRILQGAKKGFQKKYRGIPVIGVKTRVKPGNYRGLSRLYNRVCRRAEFIIASPNELASDIDGIPCIAINHGVNFDGLWTSSSYSPVGIYTQQTDSIINSDCCVCVDTNFINWMRTKDYMLSQKLVYIPNYYDQRSFHERVRANKDDRIVFVYPRRIYEPRGYDITIKAFRKVLAEHPEVELRLVGQFDNDRVKADVEAFIAEFPKNVSHEEYPMEEAYRAYDGADVILVPTRYSEGTSLSCIEGQAAGLPVIATNIGGLPNLILDHFNGLLIAPTAKALERAVLELVENPKLRKEMGRHSLEVAKSSFEKHLWDKRWTDVIKEFEKQENRSEKPKTE